MSTPLRPSHLASRSRFITPIASDALLDPGVVFPADDLRKRILSHFWRDCCLPHCFARAPAPAVEVAADGNRDDGTRPRLGAWWLLLDGIIEDDLGPDSDRLRPFFGGIGRTGQLWPRYEFTVQSPSTDGARRTFVVDLTIHAEPMRSRRHGISVAHEAEDILRVIEWKKTSRQ